MFRSPLHALAFPVAVQMKHTTSLGTYWPCDPRALRRQLATFGDKPELLGILHFAQRDHHGVSFYRVVLGDKKVHAIGQYVDDARAAPLAAAKNIPKLIAFDFLHGILRLLSSDARFTPAGLTSVGANRLESRVQDPWASWGLHTQQGS